MEFLTFKGGIYMNEKKQNQSFKPNGKNKKTQNRKVLPLHVSIGEMLKEKGIEINSEDFKS
jgi:hypothetical protein